MFRGGSVVDSVKAVLFSRVCCFFVWVARIEVYETDVHVRGVTPKVCCDDELYEFRDLLPPLTLPALLSVCPFTKCAVPAVRDIPVACRGRNRTEPLSCQLAETTLLAARCVFSSSLCSNGTVDRRWAPAAPWHLPAVPSSDPTAFALTHRRWFTSVSVDAVLRRLPVINHS